MAPSSLTPDVSNPLHKFCQNGDSVAVPVSVPDHVQTKPSLQYLTAVQIPCCLCGTMIYPNAANQCPTCLAQDFNLQHRVQRGPNGAPHTTIYQCRECRRYMRTEKYYENAEPESSQLLALCLKHIPALQNNYHHTTGSTTSSSNNNTASDYVETKMAPLHIVDAKWIWTEPHSMRLKVHLTVRTELSNVPVQQRCAVEMQVAWKQCPDCAKEYTSRTWHAIVQLRQKQQHCIDAVQTKKGLTVVETALGKAKPAVRKHILRLDHVKSGFDFYFMSLAHAQAFVAYLQGIVPMRTKTSHKLVSTDSKNNTAHMKHTITADIVPLLKHDLILIDKSTPKTSLAGTVAIVLSISSGMILLQDASPSIPRGGSSRKDNNNSNSNNNNTGLGKLTPVLLSAEAYYKHEKNYTVLQSSNRMIRFVVLDVELFTSPELLESNVTNTNAEYKGPKCGVSKYALAEVEVARESDMGVTNDTFRIITHLGHLLQAGDVALGYDLTASTINLPGDCSGSTQKNGAVRNNFVLPDIVLIKKASSALQGQLLSDDYDEGNYSIMSRTIPAEKFDSIDKDNETDRGADEKEEEDNTSTNIRYKSHKNMNLTASSTESKSADIGSEKHQRLTKTKQRRRTRQEGKRKKQLEQSAIRMGLISSPPSTIPDVDHDDEYSEGEDNEDATTTTTTRVNGNHHHPIINVSTIDVSVRGANTVSDNESNDMYRNVHAKDSDEHPYDQDLEYDLAVVEQQLLMLESNEEDVDTMSKTVT